MKCKPGDMAVILRDPNFNGRDVGCFVEVLEPGATLGDWSCRSKGRKLAHFLSILGMNLPFGRSREVDIPDAWLKPIKGLPVCESTQAKKGVSA